MPHTAAGWAAVGILHRPPPPITVRWRAVLSNVPTARRSGRRHARAHGAIWRRVCRCRHRPAHPDRVCGPEGQRHRDRKLAVGRLRLASQPWRHPDAEPRCGQPPARQLRAEPRAVRALRGGLFHRSRRLLAARYIGLGGQWPPRRISAVGRRTLPHRRRRLWRAAAPKGVARAAPRRRTPRRVRAADGEEYGHLRRGGRSRARVSREMLAGRRRAAVQRAGATALVYLFGRARVVEARSV